MKASATMPALMDRQAARWFTHAALASCLCLQRFCVYVSGSPVYVCLLVFVALLVWLLVTGRATIRAAPAILFSVAAVLVLISALIALNSPDPRITAISVASLLSLLLLYAGLVVAPTSRFDGSQVFAIFVVYLRLSAALGIVEYVAQFVGVRLFSFMVAVPALKSVVVEPLFNYWPVLHYGSTTLRSNGFFLVEPSTFSQLLALGLVVEVFVRRDWRFLPLYAVAYLVSFAGSGLLALAVACAALPLVAPGSSGRLVVFGLALLVVAAGAALAAPETFASLIGRIDEVRYAGTSGYARYVAQTSAFDAVWGETRSLIGYGPGAFERASFYTPGSGNPLVKLFIDYGILGVATVLSFFICALWRRDIALVSLFTFANFQLGGGNLLFPPFVILSAVLCIWSAPMLQPRAKPLRTSRFMTARNS